MAIVNFPPYQPIPFHTVTPFTIRDGETFALGLKRLQEYLKSFSHEYGDALEKLDERTTVRLAELTAAVNVALEEQTTEVEQKLNDQTADVDQKLADQAAANDVEIGNLIDYVNDSVQQIINNSVEVQDPVIAGAVDDNESLTHESLVNFSSKLTTFGHLVTHLGMYDEVYASQLSTSYELRSGARKASAIVSDDSPLNTSSFTGTFTGLRTLALLFDASDATVFTSGVNSITVAGGVITVTISGFTRTFKAEPENLIYIEYGVLRVIHNGRFIGRWTVSEPSTSYTFTGKMLAMSNTVLDSEPETRNAVSTVVNISMLAPKVDDEVLCYTVDEHGNELFKQGDVDAVYGVSIASITKMLNALVVAKYVPFQNMSDEVEILASDMFSTESVLQVGDRLTIDSLLKLSAIPSNSTAPTALGRYVGENYIPGGGNALNKFLIEMNALLAQWGFVYGAHSNAVHVTSYMSAKQVAKLTQELGNNNYLKTIFGTLETDVAVVGVNARTIPISNTLKFSSWVFPEFLYGKSGSNSPWRFQSYAWDYRGVTYYSVVLYDRDTNVRYDNLMYQVEYVKTLVEYSNTGTNMQTAGSGVPTTSERDIKQIMIDMGAVFAQTSSCTIIRTGTTVTLNVLGLVIGSAGASVFPNLIPLRMRPVGTIRGLLYSQTSEMTLMRAGINGETGTLEIGGGGTNFHRGTLSWEVHPVRNFPQVPFIGESTTYQ